MLLICVLALSFSCRPKTVVPDCPECQKQTVKSACAEFVVSFCDRTIECAVPGMSHATCEQRMLPLCAGFGRFTKEESVLKFYQDCIYPTNEATCETINEHSGIIVECRKYLDENTEVSEANLSI